MASTHYHIDTCLLNSLIGQQVKVLYNPADVHAEGPNEGDFYVGTMERVFMASPLKNGMPKYALVNRHIPGVLTACVKVDGRGYRNMTASRIVRIDTI